MESSPEHFAAGFTSRDGSGFQGRHEENVLIIFDECVGVGSEFWDAAEGMLTGENCFFLAICNPTDTGSRAYTECMDNEKWHVVEISALDHPNIAADLAGEPVLFPKAVRLRWVKGKVKEWATQVSGSRGQGLGEKTEGVQVLGCSGVRDGQATQGVQVVGCSGVQDGQATQGVQVLGCSGIQEGGPPSIPPQAEGGQVAHAARAGDFEFPPGSGNWYRPGALFESRVLGRWPSQGSNSVWSEAVWAAALVRQEVDPGLELVIGCDVARFGDDFTSIVVRRGNCVLHHETYNGMSTAHTAGRLKQLATTFGAYIPRRASPEYDPLRDSDDARDWYAHDPSYRRVIYLPGEKDRVDDQVEFYIDDDGVGGGVVDQSGDAVFYSVSGATRANDCEGYPNKRSELWFDVAERAARGELDLSRLSKESLKLIQRQVMAPMWKLDGAGRRVVEPKAVTKKRIGRSPDDADALNLAFTTGVKIEYELGKARDPW